MKILEKLRDRRDKKWADSHGLIGHIAYYVHGLRGKALRKQHKESKKSFNFFMRLLK